MSKKWEAQNQFKPTLGASNVKIITLTMMCNSDNDTVSKLDHTRNPQNFEIKIQIFAVVCLLIFTEYVFLRSIINTSLFYPKKR